MPLKSLQHRIKEALCIATLASVTVLVPHHYDMFTFNTVDVSDFSEWAREAFPHQRTCIMRCGEKNIFQPEDGPCGHNRCQDKLEEE